MLCDICKKKEAVIHIQEISSEGKKIINLCNECAEKHSQAEAFLNFGEINVGDMLKNIQKISAGLLKQKKIPENSPICPKCGWNMQKMEENNGLLGCDKCYDVFKQIIDNAVNNIHHSRIHCGKRPHKEKNEPLALRREKLRKLEIELQSAIQIEEYERAAVIRDEIAALKKTRKKESAK